VCSTAPRDRVAVTRAAFETCDAGCFTGPLSDRVDHLRVAARAGTRHRSATDEVPLAIDVAMRLWVRMVSKTTALKILPQPSLLNLPSHLTGEVLDKVNPRTKRQRAVATFLHLCGIISLWHYVERGQGNVQQSITVSCWPLAETVPVVGRNPLPINREGLA